jgi:hypothetical protein
MGWEYKPVEFKEFVRVCDSGAGPYNHKNMRTSSNKEVDVALSLWFNQN